MWKIILIWWLPTSGKTTFAKYLKNQYGYEHIEADFLRNVHSKIIKEVRSFHTADEFYTQFDTPEKATNEYFRWLNSHSEYFRTFIEELYSYYNNPEDSDKNYILEWDSLIPEVLSKFPKNGSIRSAIFVNTDLNHITKTVYTRGVFAEAEKYSDQIKPKEIEWLKNTTKRLIKESEEFGIPVFDTKNTSYKEISDFLGVS